MDITNLPQADRILRCADVLNMTGLSRSVMYAEIKHDRFPRPVQLTRGSVGWKESKIQEWIADRPCV